MLFRIDFTPSANADLGHFRVVDQRIIVAGIRTHLAIDADIENRHRKCLAPNLIAPWELRVGDFRVFYEIQERSVVNVLAVGLETHNDLFIRGKRAQL